MPKNYTLEELEAMLEQKKKEEEKKKILAQHKNKIYASRGNWYTKLPGKGGKKKTICRSTKEKIEEAVIDYYKGIKPKMTVGEAFELSQRKKGKHLCEATIIRNATDYNRFYGDWEKREIAEVTAEELKEHLVTEKEEKKLTRKGYANLLAVTRSIFRYAEEKNFTEIDCDKVIRSLDLGNNSFNYREETKEEDLEEEEEGLDYFTDEEVKRIVSYIKGDLNLKRLGILLMIVTGLRVGELTALTWGDYDEELQQIKVKHTETLHTKIKRGAKTKAGRRPVPIPSAAVWIMEALKERYLDNKAGYIFF